MIQWRSLPQVLPGLAFYLLVSLDVAAHPCESCHPKEVAAYSHSAMAHSLRPPANEPVGAFTTESGTRFTIRSGSKGTWHRMERFGGAAEYRVAYAIGSGSHATGYLIQVRDHLFESPVCYYTSRGAYNLCPGYEQVSEPDFTRPVGEECVLCHSGRPLHVAGTANQFKPPVFLEQSISCGRCHGSSEEHLRRPVPGSIINPRKLAPAARDSICEQCHLTGSTQRILNPGKNFEDFHPGQPLEDVFTVYTRAGRGAFKVISHAEQLALSACARKSQDKFWCGTCHDPHPQHAPTSETYNARCQSCHENKLEKSHTSETDCIRCHMTRRPAQDGGHTVFTDHRISIGNQPDEPVSQMADLKPWRDPPPALRVRNLGLAYVNAGISSRSPADVVRGYRLLQGVQKTTPEDVAVLQGIGRALLAGGKPLEAVKAFEWVLKLTPNSAASEADLGMAFLESGQLNMAASHLERAIEIDPLLLPAGTALQEVYRRAGHSEKADDLAERMRNTMLKKTGR